MSDSTFPHQWPAFVPTIARVLADGESHTVQSVRDSVIQTHSITPEQLAMTHAKNGQNVFVVKVAHVLARLSFRLASVDPRGNTTAEEHAIHPDIRRASRSSSAARRLIQGQTVSAPVLGFEHLGQRACGSL